ncbi:hypothetical protein J7M07_01735 [bacterium]|nr:hypothetical protein [bacterium]
MISIVTDNKIEIKMVTSKKFRLIHDSKNVIAVIDGTKESTTHTIHEVDEFDTFQEVEAFIKERKLIKPQEVIIERNI